MKTHVLQLLGLLLCYEASGCAQADSEVDVTAGDITQTSTGSHIVSEINIGSSNSDRTGGLQVHVDVGDVAAKASGSGNRSTINLGSAEGKDTSGFRTRVVIGGKVVLDTNSSEGEINIGGQTAD
ncbi:MAG: hypothetical protein ACR2RB_18620 [Gammaproteobacteria bacterium]